jgi:hypothetical protein
VLLLVDVLGWAGAAAVLLGYARVTRDPAVASGRHYLLLNLSGSAGLAASGATHAAWPSAAVNVLWLAFALAALRRRRATTRRDASRHGRVLARDG